MSTVSVARAVATAPAATSAGDARVRTLRARQRAHARWLMVADLVTLTVAVVASPSAGLWGHSSTDWLVFAALAAGPMMIGHTGVNYALRYMPAYVANLATLGEPVGATIIAWALPAIREVPSVQVVVGGVLVGAGILVGLRGAATGGATKGS